jgi:hypothetical protein
VDEDVGHSERGKELQKQEVPFIVRNARIGLIA